MVSFVKSFLTINATRWLSVFFTLLAGMIVYLQIGFAEISNQIFVLTDYLVIATLITVALFFGWLGFSTKGKKLLRVDEKDSLGTSKKRNIPKILVASYGIAGGLWLILIVLSLVIQGADLATRMFDQWVILALVVISFPIAYKWLK